MINTFEKYSKKIPEFLKTILETKPDYIVPVERKGCKLLRSLNIDHNGFYSQIRYKLFFLSTKPDIRGKKIAIIDDASKYTSTLFDYRQYFESLGAIVDTYSFVGQILLETAGREQYDKKAVIFQYLNESTYQEYIIQQSLELSKDDHSFDIDHFVFRTSMSKDRYSKFFEKLNDIGEIDISNDVYTPSYITKICLYNLSFEVSLPFGVDEGIYSSPLLKIRFAYNENTENLAIVPMFLVSWNTKVSTDNSYLTRNVPFFLPYNISNDMNLESMYMNIIYTSNLFLLKCFLRYFSEYDEFNNCVLDEYNLIAYVGNEQADLLKVSASDFLFSNLTGYGNSRTMPIQSIIPILDSPKLTSVMSLMKELRGKYERLLENGGSIFTTRFFMSYDEMFARYTGRANLMKWIDILCDRGVLVVRNILRDGIYYRACRSGEADFDHIERKASLLLPIAINECGKKKNNVYRIGATLLNKVLANLAYDYPEETYDFHNFFTRPYLYGPFTYAKNRLNDEIAISLYDAERISKYCIYDENEKEFISIDLNSISNEIDSCFAQTDAVPFTEITSYINFLQAVSDEFGKADALNELIICRDQDIYYRHVHFNIVTAFFNIQTAYRTNIPSKAEKYIRDAARVANEATKKLNYDQKELFNKLKATVGSKIRYRTAYKRIVSAKVDFSDEFVKSLPNLIEIASLEQATINLMLYQNTLDIKYLDKFIKLSSKVRIECPGCIENLRSLCMAKTEDEYNNLFKEHSETIQKVINQLYVELNKKIHLLRKPNDSDHVLSNRRRDMDVAINKCIQYIKRLSLFQYAILQFDFSGFRNVENTKAINVIEQVQNITTSLAKNLEKGLFIYGLVGSSTFGTLLFTDMESAIQFAKELLSIFTSPTLDQIDFRFGCSYRIVSSDLRENINEAWKDAYNCSKLFVSDKPSCAGFVISNGTFLYLNDTLRSDFMLLRKEDSDTDEATYYTHNDFESSDSERIIRYDSDTDNNVKIGIITALTEEFVAMQKMLIEPKTVVFPTPLAGRKATGREYCVGRIRSLDGNEHRIALTQTLGPGNTSAALRADCLLDRFPNLDVIIMTGIAGGVPSPDDKNKHVRLGDIIVAKGIVAYDFVSEKRTITELRGRPIAPCPRLIEAQNHLDQNAFMGYKPWEGFIKEISRKMPIYEQPPETTDILYGHNKEIIPHPVDTSRNGFPRVFKEKIASANRVLKNPKKRDALKKTYGVYAVEMEGSGVADATWEAEIGYYVIRGISDYCDGNKNDLWHNYAALVAAAYTRALIEKLPS